MSKFTSGLLKLLGFGLMIYGIYVILYWYSNWISYYIIGNIKPSVIVALFTFFLAPIAGLADLFWHSFKAETVDMWIRFLMFFVGGRILLAIEHKFGNKSND